MFWTRTKVLFAGMLLLAGGAMAGLVDYVQRPDDSYAHEIVETRHQGDNTIDIVQLTSQTWQGIPWRHWLIVVRPPEVRHPDKALLLIHGGENRETPPAFQNREAEIMGMIAAQTKSAVAVIYQVPNQPLFDGRKEDAIIAFTYEKFLRGEGDDWPLLLPMVKSAVRGMDAIQAILKEKYAQEVTGFMLTGGSKRGWTTWLAAATGDPRVKAIAPSVIDVLNMKPQMDHQLACYGGYSDQVDDYTELSIQQYMDTPEGKRLLSIVDPYAYREKMTLPKLVLLGANDPYWTVDAANLYFPGLQGEKHLYYQANVGHDVSLDGVSTLLHFYSAFLTGTPFPAIKWSSDSNGALEVRWDHENGKALLWQAHSPNRDFRPSTWTSAALEGSGKVAVKVVPPESGWTAFYVEVQFPGTLGLNFGSCTEMTVIPKTMPAEGRAYDAVAQSGAETEQASGS